MDTNPMDNHGSRDIGPVRIGWTFDDDGAGCGIVVDWLGQSIAKRIMDGRHPRFNFDVRTESAPYQRVSGELWFDTGSGTLTLKNLAYPGGSATDVLLARSRPVPPSPADDDDAEVEQAIVGEAGDLFPYIHLRAWPPASDRALADRFVFYATACAIDDPRLYCRLAAIDRKQAGARARMIEQALRFVRGQSPYEGQFAASPAALGPEFVALGEFAILAERIEQPTTQVLIDLIVELWGQPWPAIIESLGSTAFAQVLDRAWQNVFALDCVLGYDRGNLGWTIRAITAARLLQRMAGDLDADWPPQRLRDGLQATVVLPATIFPLPSALSPDLEEMASITILPYAIGNLHLVKRRLLGYALGEVSHVESVMADEKKLRARHERFEEESRSAAQALEQDSHDEERSGSGLSLEAQVRATLREQFQIDYSTNYGPPTESEQTGSYTRKLLDDSPTREDETARSRLARRVTERAAQRVSSRLGEQRLHHRRHARQSETSQCFDRRGRNENQRGIYRWLDARYRCWVTRIGRRLMLEYFVPHPAARMAAARYALTGVDLVRPVPPARLGLRRFDDISLDPGSDLYYATLAARYGVDASPPPPPRAYACAVFESGAPLLSQLMVLPPGYAAATATLSLTTASTTLTARGRIGASEFVVGDGRGGSQTVALTAQTNSLPVSVAIVLPAPAATVGNDEGSSYGLNVEVELRRTLSAIVEWKSRLYDLLLEGYRRQEAHYLEAAGLATAHRVDPLACQRTIRGELKRAGMRGFLQLAVRRTGELRRERHFAPALQLWLEQSLEWTELTYALIDDPEAEAVAGGDGEPFTAFLQAAYARVLLPVAPDRERSLLYYLASGMVWTGEDALAPTFDSPVGDDGMEPPAATTYVDLMDDLKATTAPLEPIHTRDSWTLVLPTAMSVLQDGDRLPEFPEPA